MSNDMGFDLAAQLTNQLKFHWEIAARPRLEGLTDEEYFWEPVANCWSVRRKGKSAAAVAVGAGEWLIDFEIPEPEPAPVTTVAWRLAHLIVGIFGERNHSHFGGPGYTYSTFEYAGTADAALTQLDEVYSHWITAVAALDNEALARPVGEAEGPFAESPMIELVLHIHREVIHHMAEIALLRDLYRRSYTTV